MKILHVVFLVFWSIFVVVQSRSAQHESRRRHPRYAPEKRGAVDDTNWWQTGQSQLEHNLGIQLNCGVAKNVIFFMGDGMGPTSLLLGRILKGQDNDMPGEETDLSWDTFPYVSLAKTYNTDKQVADSAGTATAFHCGVKAKYGVIGVNDTANRGDCDSALKAEVNCMADWAQAAGKSTGLVTTMRVTHASPSPLYAHSADRDWEYDTHEMPGACKDIAAQLVDDEPGKNLNVILGGGRRNFMPTGQFDPEIPTEEGRRNDNRNLTDDWIKQKTQDGLKYAYVTDVEEFHEVNTEDVDYLLGLFDPTHLPYLVDKPPEEAGDPTLSEMVEKAIQILSKNDNGYYLFAEGGNIDWAHHDNRAQAAAREITHLDDAVMTALEMTSEEDTLIIVTADHSHSITFAGYPPRGNPLFEKTGTDADDGMPYTAILYGTGPGYYEDVFNYTGARPDITNIDTTDPLYVQQATVPREFDAHGGEDVPVYARGPMAHLFSGSYEQHYIAHALAYASCVDLNAPHCSKPLVGVCASSSSGSIIRNQSAVVSIIVILCLMILVYLR